MNIFIFCSENDKEAMIKITNSVKKQASYEMNFSFYEGTEQKDWKEKAIQSIMLSDIVLFYDRSNCFQTIVEEKLGRYVDKTGKNAFIISPDVSIEKVSEKVLDKIDSYVKKQEAFNSCFSCENPDRIKITYDNEIDRHEQGLTKLMLHNLSFLVLMTLTFITSMFFIFNDTGGFLLKILIFTGLEIVLWIIWQPIHKTLKFNNKIQEDIIFKLEESMENKTFCAKKIRVNDAVLNNKISLKDEIVQYLFIFTMIVNISLAFLFVAQLYN